jgi:hypothetical protein
MCGFRFFIDGKLGINMRKGGWDVCRAVGRRLADVTNTDGRGRNFAADAGLRGEGRPGNRDELAHGYRIL